MGARFAFTPSPVSQENSGLYRRHAFQSPKHPDAILQVTLFPCDYSTTPILARLVHFRLRFGVLVHPLISLVTKDNHVQPLLVGPVNVR